MRRGCGLGQATGIERRSGKESSRLLILSQESIKKVHVQAPLLSKTRPDAVGHRSWHNLLLCTFEEDCDEEAAVAVAAAGAARVAAAFEQLRWHLCQVFQ